MGWNCHDCACTVRNKNVVCNPNRNLLSVYRVNGIASAKDTSLFFCKVRALKVALLCGAFNVCFYGSLLFCGCKLCNKGVLRGNNHVCGTKKCVAPCGVYAELFPCGGASFCNGKVNFCTFAASNPVLLHKLYAFRPVKFIQALDKLVCIGGNLKNPLADSLVCYR